VSTTPVTASTPTVIGTPLAVGGQVQGVVGGMMRAPPTTGPAAAAAAPLGLAGEAAKRMRTSM